MGYELVQLGLRRRLTWAEAELVLEAITQYDREEAVRHNRRQEIIRNGGLPPADAYTVTVDPLSVPPN